MPRFDTHATVYVLFSPKLGGFRCKMRRWDSEIRFAETYARRSAAQRAADSFPADEEVTVVTASLFVAGDERKPVDDAEGKEQDAVIAALRDAHNANNAPTPDMVTQVDH
jgi:hypothetical protein